RCRFTGRQLAPAFETVRLRRVIVDIDPMHSRNLHGRGDDAAQVHRLTEGEVIGMEEAAPPVRKIAIAECIEQRLLHIGAEVALRDAHGEGNIEGHKSRGSISRSYPASRKSSRKSRRPVRNGASTGRPLSRSAVTNWVCQLPVHRSVARAFCTCG